MPAANNACRLTEHKCGRTGVLTGAFKGEGASGSLQLLRRRILADHAVVLIVRGQFALVLVGGQVGFRVAGSVHKFATGRALDHLTVAVRAVRSLAHRTTAAFVSLLVAGVADGVVKVPARG